METLSLEKVAEEFTRWRSTKTPGEKIPEALWQQVDALRTYYSRGKISQRLGISGGQLTKRDKSLSPATSQTTPLENTQTEFVTLSSALTPAAKQSCIEVVQPNGCQLRFVHHNLDALAVVFKHLIGQ